MNINITEIYFWFLLHIELIEFLQELHIVIVKGSYKSSFYLFYFPLMDFWHFFIELFVLYAMWSEIAHLSMALATEVLLWKIYGLNTGTQICVCNIWKCQLRMEIFIVYFKINIWSQSLLSLFQLKGLCGNYNDNQLDDFQTPSGGLSEVSARLFGDSWRLQSYCPESVDVVVSIQFNFKITRKLWLTRNGVLIVQCDTHW